MSPERGVRDDRCTIAPEAAAIAGIEVLAATVGA
jgi:hypothetical protein